MSQRTLIPLAATLVALSCLPAQAVTPQLTPTPTACTPDEQVVFQCDIGARRVAVCASRGLGAQGGQLQYRYGRPAAVELAYPSADTPWRDVTRGGTLMFSGGGGAWLAFTRGEHRYVVYTAIGQGWGDKAGVVVERGGRRLAVLGCTRPPVSDIGPDLFERAGIPTLEEGFELP